MPQETVTLDCPHCGDSIVVVIPDDADINDATATHASHDDGSPAKDSITASVLAATENEPIDPYSGSDTDIPVEHTVQATIAINGDHREYTFWYTPDYDYFSHVVRGPVGDGLKSKNAYPLNGDLTFTNRGHPRDSNKNWTYLDEDTCHRRSQEADLGDVVKDPDHPDKDNRYRIHLDERARPLMDVDGDIDEPLLETLTRGLIAFKS